MRESSGIIFSYFSRTWTRSSSCSRSPTSTRSPVKDRIVPRCNLSSPSHSRCPTSCRSVSQGRNSSWSRSPSTGTMSPKVTK